MEIKDKMQNICANCAEPTKYMSKELSGYVGGHPVYNLFVRCNKKGFECDAVKHVAEIEANRPRMELAYPPKGGWGDITIDGVPYRARV